MYKKSDERIKENNDMVKKDEDDDEDEVEEDKELVKEENKSEFDLQLSIAEIFGIFFKTHKNICGNLIQNLFA